MSKLRNELFDSMNEIKTRGIKLTPLELKKLGIHKIVNIVGTPEYMIAHNIGCVVHNYPGYPYVTEKAMNDNGLITVSIIFFRQILFMERYMLRNDKLFTQYLFTYTN